MTTQLFPTLNAEQIAEASRSNERAEVEWLLNSIVRPQLPEIKEGLESCLRQVSEDNETVFKLPLSSHKSEMLKGTIERQNFKVVALNVQIKAHSFNGGKAYNLKLLPEHSFILRQLLDCHDLIYNAVQTINKIESDSDMDPQQFIMKMDRLYDQICRAKKSLDYPNPAYYFPKYRLPAAVFDPEMPEEVSLDFFINNSELTADFQSLKRVTRKPWCYIVDSQNRISYADKVRATISKDRTRSVHRIIVDEYQKLLKQVKVRQGNGEEGFWKGLFGASDDPSLSTLLKSAKAYLEKCITYVNNQGDAVVVQVVEKCEMVTSDPILLSLGIKLDSLEKAVDRMVENLRAMSN